MFGHERARCQCMAAACRTPLDHDQWYRYHGDGHLNQPSTHRELRGAVHVHRTARANPPQCLVGAAHRARDAQGADEAGQRPGALLPCGVGAAACGGWPVDPPRPGQCLAGASGRRVWRGAGLCLRALPRMRAWHRLPDALAQRDRAVGQFLHLGRVADPPAVCTLAPSHPHLALEGRRADGLHQSGAATDVVRRRDRAAGVLAPRQADGAACERPHPGAREGLPARWPGPRRRARGTPDDGGLCRVARLGRDRPDLGADALLLHSALRGGLRRLCVHHDPAHGDGAERV